MPYRSRSRVLRGSAPRRRMEWVTLVSTAMLSLAADTSTVGVFTTATVVGAAIARLTSPTIMRIRGSLTVRANVSGAAPPFAYGIGVANAQALAAGVASLPDAVADGDFPWLYWTFGIALDDAVGGTDEPARREIDSKAMRKLGSGDTSLFISMVNLDPGNALSFIDGFRILLKE